MLWRVTFFAHASHFWGNVTGLLFGFEVRLKFKCHTCGKEHDGLPDVGYKAPDHYFDVPAEDRSTRTRLTADTCSIDDGDFFIRGVIQIPLINSSDKFGLGVWISLAPKNFQIYLDNFDTPDIGPFLGWLCNRMPFYSQTTLSLKARAHFQGKNQRPLIELEPTDHPLSVDFRNGITVERAWEIVHG